MAEMRELAAGQSISLPPVVLRARLTGTGGPVTLTALNAQDEVASFRRVDAATVLVHPGAGRVRLVAQPASSGPFEPGTRLGIDIRVESSHVEAQQVLVQPVDVGALAEYELARLDLTPGDAWTMVASAGRPISRGLSLERDDFRQADGASSTLDEQKYPWISAGRYAFRGSRGGAASTAATATSWALVLDASVSMRSVFNPDTLTRLVELVAGILSEWTGRLPTVASATGLTIPVTDDAAERPADLVADVLDSTQPPTWSIVTPAVSDAVRLGARVVAVVTDGAPADTRDLASFVASRRNTRVLVVAAGRSAYSLPVDRVAGVEELGALADLGTAPNMRVVAVDAVTATDSRRAVELADALTGVA
jgi:hypothetical protein